MKKEINNEYIFACVDGMWRRVDSQEPQPPTLAEFLATLNVQIDDDCQFCRIIRYNGEVKNILEYRAYGGKIRINLNNVCIQ